MAARGLSVGSKLTVAASAFALALIAGLAGTLLRRDEARLLAQAEAAAQTYARAAREAMSPRLDPFALHYATHDVLKTPGVVEACVVDAEGRVLSDSDARRIGELDLSARATGAAERRVSSAGLELLERVGGADRRLGGVRLRLTRVAMSAALADSRRAVFILAGLAGLFNIFGVVLMLGRERERMRAHLGRFVNAEVAENVVDGEIRLEGRLCDVSVLFTDLRGFTRLSEHLPPQEVMHLLNDYFEEMVRIIDQHGGWVDKFMGDGLLAVFGEKRGYPDHAARAVACALELRECLGRFNVQRGQRGLAALRLGASVNSGPVVAGTVGSKERLDFTVIGDTVNVASRLEGLNAKLGTDLIVAEATYERTRAAFSYRPLGEVEVRGHDAVTAYRLVGYRGSRQDTPNGFPVIATR